MTTLDELVDALPGVGLRLHNLFQGRDGGWEAQVCDRDATVGYTFGRAATPVDALLAALKVAGIKFEERDTTFDDHPLET